MTQNSQLCPKKIKTKQVDSICEIIFNKEEFEIKVEYISFFSEKGNVKLLPFKDHTKHPK